MNRLIAGSKIGPNENADVDSAAAEMFVLPATDNTIRSQRRQ
jgi:hypothetical protein